MTQGSLLELTPSRKDSINLKLINVMIISKFIVEMFSVTSVTFDRYFLLRSLKIPQKSQKKNLNLNKNLRVLW